MFLLLAIKEQSHFLSLTNMGGGGCLKWQFMSRSMGIPRRGLSVVPSSLSVMYLLSFVATCCLWDTHVITEVFVLQHEGCQVNEMPFQQPVFLCSHIWRTMILLCGMVFRRWDKAGGVSPLTLTQCTFVAAPHNRAIHGIGKMHYARVDLQHRQEAKRLFWAMNAWCIGGFIEDEALCM